MTIGDLIKELERHPPDKVIPFGFANPHSYRGVYSDVAFEPARDVTIGSILAAAREAMGRTFTGWKGGEYTMDEWTDVHLAEMGRCGEEIGPTLLAFMLTGAPPTEYGLSMYEEGRYRGRDEGSARKRASLLQAVESVVRERDEWQRAAESQNQQWSAKCEEVTEATARAEAAEAGWKRCAADLASETARANRAEERAEAAIAERDEAMKRASVAKGASEYEARRAEAAESALAAMRGALEVCVAVLEMSERPQSPRTAAKYRALAAARRALASRSPAPRDGDPRFAAICRALRGDAPDIDEAYRIAQEATTGAAPAPTPTKSKEDPTP